MSASFAVRNPTATDTVSLISFPEHWNSFQEAASAGALRIGHTSSKAFPRAILFTSHSLRVELSPGSEVSETFWFLCTES